MCGAPEEQVVLLEASGSYFAPLSCYAPMWSLSPYLGLRFLGTTQPRDRDSFKPRLHRLPTAGHQLPDLRGTVPGPGLPSRKGGRCCKAKSGKHDKDSVLFSRKTHLYAFPPRRVHISGGPCSTLSLRGR